MALVSKQVNAKTTQKAVGKSQAKAFEVPDIEDKENVASGAPTGKSVEETYQKLTQLEHVLLRPDTYIGSTEQNRTKLWVFDEGVGLTFREISYVPGLYKIFDEILVNAADNKQRDKSMDTMKVSINPEENTISVWNNGKGIPVEMHRDEKCWVPELIFGHLLTSSNYNDNEKKTTGGRNGFGAKLANIFSSEFTVETADGSRSGKKYKQVFANNMQEKGTPKVKDCKEDENWTCITFKPDLEKFKMSCLDADIVALMKKRVLDMAGCTPGVKVFLQGERVKIKNFEEYCNLYLNGVAKDPESGGSPQYVHIKPNDRWEICVAVSEGQFQQVSFVNSIATTRGGSHVNYITDQMAHQFMEYLGKKHKGMKLKPFQIKNHIWVFINCLIENPAFDSQTKETLTLKPSSFGSKVDLDDAFFKKMLKGTKILESILNFGQAKQEKDMKKTDGKRTGRITGIPKLEDANDAGTRNAEHCTLILTEGDSAKALAVSGLAVVGRDRYGVFPLRGKVANPRDANHEQIMKNEEIKNLKVILGLQQGSTYQDGPTGLRYGHVMIMADQDPDGSHIKGLIINLFHYYWPSLLRYPGFLQEFATPIVKAKKKNGRAEVSFFTLQQYEEWRREQESVLSSWTIKYYKGLGTSSSQEAKEYFSNLPLHRMNFAWEGADDGEIIEMVFSKKRADDRKQWLLKYQEDVYVDHNASEVSYTEFVNKELIHFSMMDNTRSIPSLVDGLKPGQRKILFACFKRKLKQEIKVAQLAGYVAEHSAYHHGEQSLAMAIINMAQNFVGSNNLNLLFPSGQFGTRLQGGADAASPRYIFTFLNTLTRMVFDESDDAILKYLDDDGQSIEPQWYVPIIPMVLVNGAHGIGTGWSTDVPTFNPHDIVSNIRRLLHGEVMEPMHPWFKGFKGTVDLVVSKKGEVSYTIGGLWNKVNETTLEVTELPVGKWTQQYKEFLEELMDTDGGKKEPFIRGYREYHTDTTVHFEVQMSEKSMQEAEECGIAKKFQLVRNLTTTNMHLFNSDGQIYKYSAPEDILREFFALRLQKYGERKDYIVADLQRQLSVSDNKVRFIREVIAGTLVVSNRKKADVVADLVCMGYTPMAKESKKKAEEEEKEDAEEAPGLASFDYLLNMAIMTLTLERVNQLQAERDARALELETLLAKSPSQLWEEDLDRFVAGYEQFELEEAARDAQQIKKKGGKGGKSAAGKKPAKKRKSWGSDDEDDDIDDDDSEDDYKSKKAPVKKALPVAKAAVVPKPAAVAAPKPSVAIASAAKEVAKPKEAVPITAFFEKASAPPAKKAKVSKKKSSDDEDSVSESGSDGDYAPKKEAPKKAFATTKAKPVVADAKKAGRPKKKAASDEDEFDMDDAFAALAAPRTADEAEGRAKPRRAAAMKKPVVIDSDEDFDEDRSDEDELAKRPAKPKSRSKAADDSDDDFDPSRQEDDDDDFNAMVKKTKAAAPKSAAPKPAAPKAAAPKAAAPKAASKAKPAQDSDDDEGYAPAKKAPAKSKKPADSDDDFDPYKDGDDDDDYAPSKPKAVVARKPTYGGKPVSAAAAASGALASLLGKSTAAPKSKPAVAEGAKAKGGKKKADSEDDDSDGGIAALPSKVVGKPAAAPAGGDRPSRRAATKAVKYQESDDSEVSLLDEDSGSDYS